MQDPLKNDPIEFDNTCRFFIKRIVDEMDSMCLKDRQQAWEILAGFVAEHLNWFEKIKEMIRNES